MFAIGEDILSIGSRKWESNQNSTFESAPNLSDHAAFMLPNVENVSLQEWYDCFNMRCFQEKEYLETPKYSNQRNNIDIIFYILISHISFLLLPQPAEFCSANFSAVKGKDYNQEIQFMKGTTTLAFKVRSDSQTVNATSEMALFF